MTTSFRPKFPAAAIRNLRAYTLQETLSPADWAKRETAALRSGDILVCFNPAGIADGAKTELEASALLLVYSGAEQGAPQALLITDDFYVSGTAEAVLRERALAAVSRQNIFSFVNVPYSGALNEESRKFMSAMQRWGSGGTRANPMHGLPDPLLAFLSALGANLPHGLNLSVGVMANALIKRIYIQGLPDMSVRYANVLTQEALHSDKHNIASVTIIESPEKPASAPEQGKTSPAQDSSTDGGRELVHPQHPLEDSSTLAQPGNQGLPLQSGTQSAPGKGSGSVAGGYGSGASTSSGGGTQPEKPQAREAQPGTPEQMKAQAQTSPPGPTGAQEGGARGTFSSGTSPFASNQTAGGAESESGFLSIRKRLEARLAGRLPKSSGLSSSDSSSYPKVEASSPVVKLVSNIRQQMSIASDNLEYRVSTLKTKMLDRLVSCKHNLGEKEQANLRSLEDLRIQMQMKLESSAAQAKDQLAREASQGTSQVRNFQIKAASKLQELLSEQELLINERCEQAKRSVVDSLNATREDLNQTVSRAQHTLRSVVTTTEVNLNQVLAQSAESMDERISGFRLQTQILAEGIGLSVESMSEAAKLQGQQSEDEVVKRLELISEEALKSLREQSVRAEMECAKLIDKLAREKLVPNLQDKRKMVLELAVFFHEEFSGAIQELLENKLAEFEPIVRSYLDANASYLQDFTSRWTAALEQHQKDLDEMELRLREKVDEYLSAAKARIDSIQDISKVTEQVLSSPELIRTRDETCLKFDILSREQIAKAYTIAGDRIQSFKQESADALVELRQDKEIAIRARGEDSRNKIRNSIRAAMQKIQDLQNRYTA